LLGLVAATGYAPVQPLQAPRQAMEETARQVAEEKILALNISINGSEFAPGSSVHLTTTVRNAGTEEVLLEYFVGQLFEVIIRDESGRAVYVHSERGFQRY